MSKQREGWMVISIPWNERDGDGADWFAWNRTTRKSVACRSMKHAAETVVKMRRKERGDFKKGK